MADDASGQTVAGNADVAMGQRRAEDADVALGQRRAENVDVAMGDHRDNRPTPGSRRSSDVQDGTRTLATHQALLLRPAP